MAPKMKSIAFLTTLVLVVLGSTTAAAATVDTTSTSKNVATTAAAAASNSASNEIVTPYYLFRDVGCDDADRSIDGGEQDSGEYSDSSNSDSGEGYSPYPSRHDRRHNRQRALNNKPWEEDEDAPVIDLKSKALRSKCAKISKPKSSKGSKSSEVSKFSSEGFKSSKSTTIQSSKLSKSSKSSGGDGGDDIDADWGDSITTPSIVTQNTITQTKSSKVSGGGNGDGGSNGLPWDDIDDGYDPYPPSSPSTPSPISPSTPSGGGGGYESYDSSPPSTRSTTSPSEPSTPERTPEPTRKPTKPTRQSSCDALSVTRTSNYATLEFIYEAAISPAMTESVIDGMESSLVKFVASELLDCDLDNDDRRRQRLLQKAGESLLGSRYLGELEIVGIDATDPKDEISSRSCRYFVGKKKIEDTNCYVINGGMTLYLSEHDSSDKLRRRKLSSSEDDLEDFMEESTEDALEAIMDAMNSKDDPSPFLQQSDGDYDGEYSVSGLMGVRFITGWTYDGEEIEGDDNDDGSSEDDGDRNMGAATTGSGEATIQSSSMETVGISLTSLGLAAFIGLALIVVVRKRRWSNNAKGESYNEFKDDDDLEEDDDKRTDVDDDSYLMPSTPNTLASTPPASALFKNSQTRSRSKSAYVVGEEGSVYTNATHDTQSYLVNTSLESGNGNDDDQQVDVHHCTSAVCPICNGRETVFVSALAEDNEATTTRSSSSSNPEGYEFRYNTATFGKRSFEYEPKEKVSSPKFRNPSGIERPYVVDNTVEF
mmetsp:Transcript_35519/g.65122  ORF Transcript_35519/g.65122 Transcript_35519/m.65122 type:complete len:766 (+) Transcript_35519:40-2337(+)